MIAHVANAEEQRGRVVLWLGGGGEIQEAAVDAALRLAQAFESEVESLFIEDRQLFDIASLPFAREVSLSGRQTRTMSADALARDLKAHASAMQRQVLARARAAEVKALARVVRAEPAQALAEVCAEKGPWNVVAVGTTVRNGTGTGHLGAGLAEVFEAVHATTGVVVAGPKAQRTAGPVIAIVEELDRAVPMMRAAQRIATATGGDARLWLLEQSQTRQEWLEGQIRLALGATSRLKLEVLDMATHTPHSVAALLRRAGAGFVITRFGGLLTPSEEHVAPFAEGLDGPLFLVR
ncbi:hypothetical protein [Hyphomicrobium sp. CS1GBMeth3]|uniref:hypothetical protein n=1 Tax=Hyphomicrobium sp. CS1GBMeth3 TaxID=1892845 RepID=UPI000931D648|nr:hypothetical protein [Hyphomicrobium sp. CS1GBMeth3]